MGNLTFDVALHFGTLLAIAIFFFWDFIAMFRDGFKFKGKDGSFGFKNLTWQGKLLWLVIISICMGQYVRIDGGNLQLIIEDYISLGLYGYGLAWIFIYCN